MKKNIPLSILESLERFVNQNNKNFKVVKSDKHILEIIDQNEDSSFHFKILSSSISNGKLELLINMKPFDRNTLYKSSFNIFSDSLEKYFEEWVNLIKRYNEVQTFFDAPILEAYAGGYYAEFEIIDEDADKPLKPKQILLLDEHLEYIEENIEKHQTEKNKGQIAEIKNNIIELRENLTSNSKKEVIKGLSKIWAKLTKLGTKFMKEFLTESRKQIIKEGVKLAIAETIKNIG